MEIKEYDHVLLKTGEKASIVHVWEPGIAYIADVITEDGKIKTVDIKQDQIDKRF